MSKRVRCSRRCASTSLPAFFSSMQPLVQLVANLIDRGDQPIARRHVVRRREHRVARHLALDLAGQRIEQHQRIDLVVEQLDAQRLALGLRREDVDHVAAHAIRALREIELVALVLHVRQAPQDLALIDAVAARQMQHHRQIRLRIAEAVDRRHRRDDDRIRAAPAAPWSPTSASARCAR